MKAANVYHANHLLGIGLGCSFTDGGKDGFYPQGMRSLIQFMYVKHDTWFDIQDIIKDYLNSPSHKFRNMWRNESKYLLQIHWGISHHIE